MIPLRYVPRAVLGYARFMEPFDESCTFCRIASGETAANAVFADERHVAFLDARPLFPGHVLVVPRGHYPTLADVPDAAVGPLFSLVKRVAIAVEGAMGAQGTFVAVNNRVSQSIPHVHVHVVPRTKGDGLKGFFWPRHRYEDEAHAAAVAEAIRSALTAPPEGGG